MNRRTLVVLVGLLLLAVSIPSAFGQQMERSQIPEKYTWNLADLYPSEAAWRQAKEKLASQISSVQQYKGTLASSPQQLLAALDTMYALQKEFSRLFAYAFLLSDQDTRESKPQAMKQEMVQLGAQFGAAVAYFEPEILKMDKATIDSFIAKEPKLATYKMYLGDIIRRKEHTLSEPEEKILADSGPLAGAPSEVQSIFTNADFPYPLVKLSDGTEPRIDAANFTRFRSAANRDDRKAVMLSFFKTLGDYGRTLGAMMNANVQKDVFYMKARKYPTTVEASLDRNNIPVAVYSALVDGVNKSLPTFHRYLNLRKRMMGVDQLHYYDLYAPLVANVDLNYPIETAEKTIVAAVAPLGPEYQSVIQKAFNERWIDLYPNPGKRSGAYSEGAAYDVHPYMLINFNGQYDDMSTLAHELGHTMQSYFSNKTQPYATSDYPIFVAEVASTFNEALLLDYVLKNIKDDQTRMAILGNYLENMRLTVFRQTQFAEFELRMHEMAEKGEPITGEALDKLYMDITRKYYGHDKGVTVVDDEIAHEWSYIPHFYRNYYVFQYATSFTASQALSEKVLAGDKAATKRYLSFLSAGGSKYPIDLLRDAGVDMTTSQPLDLTMQKMNRVMDEIEKILARQGTSKAVPAKKK